MFGAGIVASDLFVSRSGNNLVVKINDPDNATATDQIIIENWYSSGQYQIETLVFSDGSSLSKAQLNTMGNVVYGTNGADTLNGFADNNTLYGYGGNDTITDSNGSDTIDGGAGDDVITDSGSGTNTLLGGEGNDTITFGSAGSNTIDGGSGNDVIKAENPYGYTANTLTGGTGNDRIESGGSADTYLFNRGDGQDVIRDYDYYSYGKTDQLVFGADVRADQLWLQQIGNNLKVNIIGTTESVTVENWYSNSVYHVEQLKSGDGKVLLDTQVEYLVQAMAAFTPPDAGQTTLPQNYQDQLSAVLAANWK